MVPRWLRWLERACLAADDGEYIGGDLEEAYWRDLRRSGRASAAARYAAALLLATPRKVNDMLSQLWTDFRQAGRSLSARPGFALTAIVTVGLGIGATTAIFSIADAVLLTPLPYPHPERLLFVSSGFPGATSGGDQLSYLDVREIAIAQPHARRHRRLQHRPRAAVARGQHTAAPPSGSAPTSSAPHISTSSALARHVAACSPPTTTARPTRTRWSS